MEAALAAEEVAEVNQGGISVQLVPPSFVAQTWPFIDDLVERACDRSNGDLTPDYVRERLESGMSALWVICAGKAAPHSFAITRILTFGERRVCQIWLSAGDGIDGWLDPVLEETTKHAREFSCDAMEICGRAGWVRKLKSRGFTEKYRTVGKELN